MKRSTFLALIGLLLINIFYTRFYFQPRADVALATDPFLHVDWGAVIFLSLAVVFLFIPITYIIWNTFFAPNFLVNKISFGESVKIYFVLLIISFLIRQYNFVLLLNRFWLCIGEISAS